MSSGKESREIMAVKLLPNVYLGDGRAASSAGFFKEAEISGVLNMTASLPNKFREDEHIEYLRVPVYDSKEKRDVNKMKEYLHVVTEFIYKITVIENRNILVHCALGRQRSCAAVAAFLIKYHKMTPIDAMRYIVQRKPDAFHHGIQANFAWSLNAWYQSLADAV